MDKDDQTATEILAWIALEGEAWNRMQVEIAAALRRARDEGRAEYEGALSEANKQCAHFEALAQMRADALESADQALESERAEKARLCNVANAMAALLGTKDAPLFGSQEEALEELDAVLSRQADSVRSWLSSRDARVRAEAIDDATKQFVQLMLQGAKWQEAVGCVRSAVRTAEQGNKP